MSSATSRRRAYYALAILLGFVVLGSLASAHRRILSLRGSSPHQLLGQPPATPTSYSNALQRSILSSDLSYAAPWTPLPLSRCEFGTPQHFAPCVAERVEGVVYAEEFLYPDFEIREPHFARPEHRERWREIAAGIRERGVLQDSGWLSYRGQHGQNFVFANVTYSGGPAYDSWLGESCMADLVSTSPIHLVKEPEEGAEILDEVLIASSPDSYAFQHHLDRITHIVTQGAHLFTSTPFVFTGKSGSGFVQSLWARLGFDEEHFRHHGSPTAVARHLIFSCRAVLVHPFLSLGALQRFGIDHNRPSSTRNKVVYMSRSNGRASNGGRKVLNEAELLDGIRALLYERKLGEELVLFDESAFSDLDSLFSWFGADVAAIIGPHGGALMHHRWAARGALVLEFMPTTFTSLAIYEEASVLSQQYAAMVVEPSREGGKDMVIEVEDVRSLLKEHLGKGETAEDPLRKYYPWKAKELGLK